MTKYHRPIDEEQLNVAKATVKAKVFNHLYKAPSKSSRLIPSIGFASTLVLATIVGFPYIQASLYTSIDSSLSNQFIFHNETAKPIAEVAYMMGGLLNLGDSDSVFIDSADEKSLEYVLPHLSSYFNRSQGFIDQGIDWFYIVSQIESTHPEFDWVIPFSDQLDDYRMYIDSTETNQFEGELLVNQQSIMTALIDIDLSTTVNFQIENELQAFTVTHQMIDEDIHMIIQASDDLLEITIKKSTNGTYVTFESENVWVQFQKDNQSENEEYLLDYNLGTLEGSGIISVEVSGEGAIKYIYSIKEAEGNILYTYEMENFQKE